MSDRVVETVDMATGRLLGRGSRFDDGAPGQLGFQGLEMGLATVMS